MAVAKLRITKSGQSGILVMGMGRDHRWYMEQPVAWFPAQSGTWTRGRNATKFRQFTYLVLQDGSSADIASLPEPPYQTGAKFTANLLKHWWIFHTDDEPFEVEPFEVPPPKKAFKIRETWDAVVSYVVAQGEAAGFEIQDEAGTKAFYIFKGVGLSVPLPKLPKEGGGLSTSGDWNDFSAPGWMGVDDFEGDATMQTIYSIGLGTTRSLNVFEFAGHVDGRVGYIVHIDSFSTGRTFGLPSSGVSSGSMTLAAPSSPKGPRPPAGCGKFGCSY